MGYYTSKMKNVKTKKEERWTDITLDNGMLIRYFYHSNRVTVHPREGNDVVVYTEGCNVEEKENEGTTWISVVKP